MRGKAIDWSRFYETTVPKAKDPQMKSCLLFFLALVAAISLAVLTESPKNGGLQGSEVTYTERERKGDTQPEEWATLELQEDRDAQSDKP